MVEYTKIAIIGAIGSGKSAAADFFVKKGFKSITIGNILRGIAKAKKINPSRKNLRKLQEELRKKYGEEFLVKKAISEVEKKGKNIVLDGLRTPQDVLTAKKNNFIIINIIAPLEIRYKRVKSRARKDEKKITMGEFKKKELEEIKLFNLDKTFSLADYIVNNSGSLEELHKNLNLILKKVKS